MEAIYSSAWDTFIRQPLPALHPWLLYAGSTTEALKQLSHHQLVINVIKQAWELPTQAEADYLHCREGETVFVREIYMEGLNEHWMFCRSIFPKKTLTGEDGQLFTQLNNCPLGKILYKNGQWKRSSFDYMEVARGNALYEDAVKPLTAAPDTLWARQSHFSHGPKIILISEVFLPELLKHPIP